jgi:hypothetical protein
MKFKTSLWRCLKPFWKIDTEPVKSSKPILPDKTSGRSTERAATAIPDDVKHPSGAEEQ